MAEVARQIDHLDLRMHPAERDRLIERAVRRAVVDEDDLEAAALLLRCGDRAPAEFVNEGLGSIERRDDRQLRGSGADAHCGTLVNAASGPALRIRSITLTLGSNGGYSWGYSP